MVNGYVFASAAALCFGVATAVQHDAAHAIPIAGVGPMRLVGRLLRDRRWLGGRALDTVAVVFQALALRSGSLVVVQCIVACGIVAAVGTSAAINRRPPRTRELVGSIVVVVGVVMVSGITHPTHGHHNNSVAHWAQVGVLVLFVATWAFLALRPAGLRVAWIPASLMLGLVAGSCFALGTGFLKLASVDARHAWQRPTAVIALVAFVSLGFVGNVASQRSFQIGELRHALPAIVAAEPVVALIAGFVMFHEHVAHDRHGALGLAGLVIVIVGVITASEPDTTSADVNAKSRPEPS